MTTEIVDQLKMVSDSRIGLFMIDERLKTRVADETEAEG